jgi:hypothetical protein
MRAAEELTMKVDTDNEIIDEKCWLSASTIPPEGKEKAIAGLARKRSPKEHTPKFNQKKCELAIDLLHRQIELFCAENKAIGGHVIEALTAFGTLLKRWFSDHLPKVVGKMSRAKCKFCGADIIWTVTGKGKNIPLDAEPTKKAIRGSFVICDGVASTKEGHPRYASHFLTCSQRKK